MARGAKDALGLGALVYYKKGTTERGGEDALVLGALVYWYYEKDTTGRAGAKDALLLGGLVLQKGHYMAKGASRALLYYKKGSIGRNTRSC